MRVAARAIARALIIGAMILTVATLAAIVTA